MIILFILKLLSRNATILYEPVAIYGAGSAGIQLIASLQRSKEFKPVALFDDSKHIQGLIVSNLKVDDPINIPSRSKVLKYSKILLAIPSLNNHRRSKILKYLNDQNFKVLTLPTYPELIAKGGFLKSLQSNDMSDLLGREKINPRLPEVKVKFKNKIILVTGAGGSIGSELCRQIITISPNKLIILDNSEFSLYKISQELSPICDENGIILQLILTSVTNKSKIDNILSTNDIFAIFHAAAYKHVPLLESNEIDGAQNNIFGTLYIAEIAAKYKIKNFVLVSTDKAVRPTNLMGATKRYSELLIQDLQNKYPNLNFSIVRFGNVLGSSGSVVPLFQKQISKGGPVTITHKNVTRYFMTIPEAAQLVLLAGCFSKGGQVFVLDMGQPVKITELATRMIKMAGLTLKDDQNPNGQIEIKYTKLRPGEKLYEELLMGNDLQSTPHPKIMIANEPFVDNDILLQTTNKLSLAIAKLDVKAVRHTLSQIVEGYKG